jgi:hypothetical protein
VIRRTCAAIARVTQGAGAHSEGAEKGA